MSLNSSNSRSLDLICHTKKVHPHSKFVILNFSSLPIWPFLLNSKNLRWNAYKNRKLKIFHVWMHIEHTVSSNWWSSLEINGSSVIFHYDLPIKYECLFSVYYPWRKFLQLSCILCRKIAKWSVSGLSKSSNVPLEYAAYNFGPLLSPGFLPAPQRHSF